MHDSKSLETFVRGLVEETLPLAIVSVEKINDTRYDLSVVMDQDLIAEVDMTRVPLAPGAPPEEGEPYDGTVMLGYDTKARILSLAILFETGVPASSHAWLLESLNVVHAPENGYVSKACVLKLEDGDRLSLVVSWEMGLYDHALLGAEGLGFLKGLVSGMVHRLFVESCSLSATLTTAFTEEFAPHAANA